MIREVIAEDSFNKILDNILTQETPYFLQFEDSPPPGEPSAAGVKCDLGDLEALRSTSRAQRAAGGPDSGRPGSAHGGIGVDSNMYSEILLDFASPFPVDPVAETDGSNRAAPFEVETALPTASQAGSASTMVSPRAPGLTEDNPQKYWEDSVNLYGEVDLDTFKRDAGEVLENILLDMVDDVVAGRLNWMRPMPRGRARRGTAA